MSEFRHQWNGTVLTVISDSGASSANLQGPRGDTGPRGPQGPAGVILNEGGEVVVDLSNYYLKEEVDALVENVEVDLSEYATKTFVTEEVVNRMNEGNYVDSDYVLEQIANNIKNFATKNYVSTEIAKAQLEGAGVDTSGFATKDDLANVSVKVDGTTIGFNALGELTFIGNTYLSCEEVEY